MGWLVVMIGYRLSHNAPKFAFAVSAPYSKSQHMAGTHGIPATPPCCLPDGFSSSIDVASWFAHAFANRTFRCK